MADDPVQNAIDEQNRQRQSNEKVLQDATQAAKDGTLGAVAGVGAGYLVAGGAGLGPGGMVGVGVGIGVAAAAEAAGTYVGDVPEAHKQAAAMQRAKEIKEQNPDMPATEAIDQAYKEAGLE